MLISKPIARCKFIFSSKNMIAKIAVNNGLKVIIKEASPAAVYCIPTIKNAW